MKKLIFVLALLFVGKLFANPVILPPVISEYSYNSGNWQMEIFLDEDIFGDFVYFTSFDELCLVCNAGVALFTPGIPFSIDSVYVIDQSWLTSIFQVDSIEDCIGLHFWDGSDDSPLGEDICYSSSSITHPPAGNGESIALQYIYTVYGEFYHYSQMIQSPPTFGTNPFNIDARCTFRGYVYDELGNPVEGVDFVHCSPEHCSGYYQPSQSCFETDENGYFECDELFPRLHNFQLTLDSYIYHTDQIFFDPQEPVYKEYTLIGVGTQAQKEFENGISISSVPNPFSHKTSFIISLPPGLESNEARITIFNMNGQELDYIPIINNPWAGGEIKVDWIPGNAPHDVGPGLYIYTLELDGRSIKSEKLIINE